MHHARWLSKAIYCLKIFLFQSQFALRAHDINGLRHICIFIVVVYVKAWFSAPKAIAAPNNDLELLKSLIRYKNINAKVSQVALRKLASHLWYLSEELVLLALFDERITYETKLKMVDAIHSRESSTTCSKRVSVEANELVSWLSKGIDEFATKNSVLLLEKFGVKTDFLDLSPEFWSEHSEYQKGSRIFGDLKVVNDVAERGVALIQRYNDCLTRDEEQKQYLLQVVQNHRKMYPNCQKKKYNGSVIDL